jgi:hypothetical protein
VLHEIVSIRLLQRKYDWARQKTRDATLQLLNPSTAAAPETLPGKRFDRYFAAFERVCTRISGSG